MARPTLRFGVHDGNAHCAATWRLWTETGKGNSEVYLANRSLGGTLKASLHQSNNWHIAFSRAAFERLVQGAIPKFEDRFVEKWPRTKEVAPGITLAFRIVTPYSALTGSKQPHEGSNVFWIENAPEGKATEIDILFTKPDVPVDGWPERDSLGTSLVGHFDLENGERVWAVSWVVEMPDLSKAGTGHGSFFNGMSREDIDSAENLKIMAFGTEPDGSRVIYDAAVQKTE